MTLYHITDLEKNWNKWISLEFLRVRDFNVPKSYLVKEPVEIELISKDLDRMSIRSFNPKSNNDFKCPHYPNVKLTKKMKEQLKELLVKGYNLIMSLPIDPKGAKVKGNISIVDEESWYMEFTYGPGTVRQLEQKDSTELIVLRNELHRSNNLLYKELGLKGLNILSKAHNLYWGVPFILEWSIYHKVVGIKEEALIFWEIRKG